MMRSKPLYTKAHAKAVADEFQRLGWIIALEFRADGADEPYEYLLKWEADEDPPAIDWSKFGVKPPTFDASSNRQT
jgi:hypothetical protein